MKLLHATIENFKGIRQIEIPIRLDLRGRPRPLTVLTGDNASGKTTALQAIALTLGLATRRLRASGDLEWHGFLPDRLGTLGPTRVVLHVQQSDEEIKAAHAMFRLWRETEFSRQIAYPTSPGSSPQLELVFQKGFIDCTQGRSGLVQLWGRYYVRSLLRDQPWLRERFADLGDVFWFDQYRNLASVQDDPTDGRAGPTWSAGVTLLRNQLLKWWGYHTRHDRHPARDWTAHLEDLVATVFPGTRFVGPEPRGAGDDEMWFLLEREGRLFDLAELSSGEQAAFALMHTFAYQAIHHSVVLVDEVELHLHPGTQQALVRMLQRMAPTCQWLLTTHSPHVADAFADDIVRLPGGTPCL